MSEIGDLPGIEPVEGRIFRYLECDSAESFRLLFPQISGFGNSTLPSRGGILNEEAIIILPTGEKFFGVSFRGDLTGWDRKVAECANANNVRVGRVIERKLVLSDGTGVPLESCELHVDW